LGRLCGFGHSLVNEGPSYEFDGTVELEFIASGVVCDIDIPSLPRYGMKRESGEGKPLWKRVRFKTPATRAGATDRVGQRE